MIIRNQQDDSRILTKAVIRACELLKVTFWRRLTSQQTREDFLKYDPLDIETNEWLFALYFVQAFKSLEVLYDGDLEGMRNWLIYPNRHLYSLPPLFLLGESIESAKDVCDYLEAAINV